MSAVQTSPPEVRPILLAAPLAAAAHVALLWGALQWTPLLSPPIPSPSFAIDLDATPASTAMPSPALSLPKPWDQPEARTEPPPVPRPLRMPAARPAPPPAPAAEQAEVAEPAPAAPVEASVPADTLSAVARPSAPTAPTLPHAEISRWQGLLLSHLERHKRYPRDAQLRRQEGAAVIHFVMDPSGRVLSVDLERSSGTESLDRESLALIERAQPLPLPPVGGTDRINLTIPIHFQLR